MGFISFPQQVNSGVGLINKEIIYLFMMSHLLATYAEMSLALAHNHSV